MMVDDKWMEDGGIFYPISGNVVLHTTPGQGIWELVKDPDPRSSRLGLKKLSDQFTFDFKLYETGGKEAIQRVYDLWNDEKYIESNKNLGVIFNGIKGTGKTIAAKILCNKIDLPVIVVNQSFEGGILEFIPRLSFEAVILIDEAEKTFSDKDDAHYLLKLIDGVYNKTRKLYILTTNKLHINENLIGRPGRIRYIQEFTNLPKEAVEEYLRDNLEDLSKIDEVMNIVDLLEISTIDILKSLVEEFNIFGGIGGDRSIMNIPKCNYIFDAIEFYGYTEEDIPLIRDIINKNKPKDITVGDWISGNTPEPRNTIKKLVNKGATGTVVEDNNEVEEEEKSALSYFCDDDLGRSAYTCRISSRYTDLYKNTETNQGTVLMEPSEDGFLLIKDDWRGNIQVYMLLKQRKNVSLYQTFKV